MEVRIGVGAIQLWPGIHTVVLLVAENLILNLFQGST